MKAKISRIDEWFCNPFAGQKKRKAKRYRDEMESSKQSMGSDQGQCNHSSSVDGSSEEDTSTSASA